jgi:hypothetical protein
MGNVTLSGTVDITIKNTGTGSLTISDQIAFDGADAAVFSLVSLPIDRPIFFEVRN